MKYTSAREGFMVIYSISVATKNVILLITAKAKYNFISFYSFTPKKK